MPTPIIMPRQGQSVESCILTSWKVKAGDVVTSGQAVASIETDKATFDVESPEAGTVLALFFAEGDDIPVLTNIAAIGKAGENFSQLQPGSVASSAEESPHNPSSITAVVTSPVASSSPAPVTAPSGAGVSPRARNAATNSGIDASALPGTGPGGRVLERDVIAAAAHAPRLTPAARDAIAAGKGVAPARGSGVGGQVRASDIAPAAIGHGAVASSAPARADREIPVKGVRKIVAERMRESLAGTAQLTLHARFDATVLQSLRRRAKEHGESLGAPRLTVNDLICHAVVRTLASHPSLNAHFLGNRMVEFGSINLGIAVDTPRGLMVPVVKQADQMPVAALAAAIRSLADQAQKGNVNPDLLSGGTFTVTNLGASGIDYFTPVLNAPEVAILGVGGISVQPVRRENGTVDFVDTIALSLTIDHQSVDGAPAARFLQALVKALENIDLLLA
jgi:pyruvate dehydrogenase E2 component (dihydrolipoamide acetyltransferase)